MPLMRRYLVFFGNASRLRAVKNKVYKSILLAIVLTLRDYTAMATNAKIPEAERHWLRVLGTLNEAQARVFVAQKALAEGRGAIIRLARLTRMSRPTILKGIAELETGHLTARDESRIRSHGGGRKRLEETDPHAKRVLARLVEASTAGDPMSYLLWTNKSTRNLADELARQGYTVSHVTVARCPRELGYSLQANVKTIEGTQHPPIVMLNFVISTSRCGASSLVMIR